MSTENTLTETNFNFPQQTDSYHGKVRDVYSLKDGRMISVASDRLSAFDVVLPKGIPFKGQILNQLAYKMMAATEDIVPNWLEASPDPNVSIGQRCRPFKVEMVIRGYLTGHAWREYKSGSRELCGNTLPDGMRENDPFPTPIITPTTKAEHGSHDEDISEEAILEQEIVNAEDFAALKKYTHQLFERGTELAEKQDLILVDTKYEFGKDSAGNIVLIDEIHTPDSSRYFHLTGFGERQNQGEPQVQLSKEFAREWLMEKGFQGKENQTPPDLTDHFVNSVSQRYIELYEKITGAPFEKANTDNIQSRIKSNVLNYLD